jgi:hypothetical protein
VVAAAAPVAATTLWAFLFVPIFRKKLVIEETPGILVAN